MSATCTSTGLTEGSHCDACSKVIVAQTTIAKISHKEMIIPAVNATCSKTGLTEGKKCSVCGEILVKQTETAKLEHSYKSVVTAPTCTEDGFTTYTCECGDTYKADETKATGHNFGDWEVVKKADVGVEGKEQRKCKSCDNTEERTIPALENPDEDILLGDVNKDGKITAMDARLALRIAAKIDTPDDYQSVAANYNKDDKITAADARLILRKAARID